MGNMLLPVPASRGFNVRLEYRVGGRLTKLTQEAASGLKREYNGQPLRIAGDEILVGGKSIALPFITCQTPVGYLCRVYTSHDERTKLAAALRIGSDKLSCGLFNLTGKKLVKTIQLSQLFLDPAWVHRFSCWLSSPGKALLPDPDSFPCSTDKEGNLVFPVIWRSAKIAHHPGNIIPGNMRFWSNGDNAMATFTHPGGVASFKLTQNQIKGVGITAPETTEDYSSRTFAELLGKANARTEYKFCKKAGKAYINLGSFFGAQLRIYNYVYFPILPGQAYFIKAVRLAGERQVGLYCYSQPTYEDKDLIAETIVPLNAQGFILRFEIQFSPVKKK